MNTVVDLLHAGTVGEWRAWLAEHAGSEAEVWLVLQHRDSPTPGVRYAEAVEQALCFGWIDGLHRRNDEHSSRLRFTPRTARSHWSALNRERAAAMTARGLMSERGRAAIEQARAVGTWEPADGPARPGR